MKNMGKYPVPSQSANRFWAEEKVVNGTFIRNVKSRTACYLLVIKPEAIFGPQQHQKEVSVTMACAVRIRDLCNDS